jgi:hypothetical protein
MPGAPYCTQAFSPLPGRCFRMVAHHGEAQPIHCPEPVTWRIVAGVATRTPARGLWNANLQQTH